LRHPEQKAVAALAINHRSTAEISRPPSQVPRWFTNKCEQHRGQRMTKEAMAGCSSCRIYRR
jgi:hypothetical protein